MEYQESISHLLSLIDFERQPAPKIPRQKQIFDLGRMKLLLDQLGNPHYLPVTIHVAGTKGKGSSAAYCDSVLTAAGFKTGFFSSPHLHSFCERIRRDSKPISKLKFAGLVENLWPYQKKISSYNASGQISLFEFMTAMAFTCFKEDGVEFQTIEVGLGGRLDATNVVSPQVAIITPISLDHMEILGNTLGEIASEKSGIIKSGVPVVIAHQEPEALDVILSRCEELNCSSVLIGQDITWTLQSRSPTSQSCIINGRLGNYPVNIPLIGLHQLENAACAVAALEIMIEKGYSITVDDISNGIEMAVWPCRMELLAKSPLTIADGAHNPASMKLLLESLPKYLDFDQISLIVGFSGDKQVPEMVEILSGMDPRVYATRSRHPRSVSEDTICDLFQQRGLKNVQEVGDVKSAGALAMQEAKNNDLILATGSLFIAAELRESILDIEPEIYPDLLAKRGIRDSNKAPYGG
ncbi:MAG: folylpolyglutamate synthase/dihydrofolate synthase family protein [Chloroflexota bacterium]|nr:folylpolyglutamate synthase/dihydrofolate synthase family protein [Chloroflexota bacterium]